MYLHSGIQYLHKKTWYLPTIARTNGDQPRTNGANGLIICLNFEWFALGAIDHS